MKGRPVVTALEVAASLAAVAVLAYMAGAALVAWFTYPHGAPR